MNLSKGPFLSPEEVGDRKFCPTGPFPGDTTRERLRGLTLSVCAITRDGDMVFIKPGASGVAGYLAFGMEQGRLDPPLCNNDPKR